LDEAIALLVQHEGDAQPIAGGQSLMPMLAFRVVAPRLLVDISRIPELGRISIGNDGVHLGALVRWRDIERDPRLLDAHPLLCAAIAHVAHYQIRNRGTVGGSLAHADPAAELPGLAVTCEAEIEIAGRAGRRLMKATDFFQAALTTALLPGELIVSVRFPVWKIGDGHSRSLLVAAAISRSPVSHCSTIRMLPAKSRGSGSERSVREIRRCGFLRWRKCCAGEPSTLPRSAKPRHWRQ
jgi:CO/xanthine dehydrogenase FAD-binding subunit